MGEILRQLREGLEKFGLEMKLVEELRKKTKQAKERNKLIDELALQALEKAKKICFTQADHGNKEASVTPEFCGVNGENEDLIEDVRNKLVILLRKEGLTVTKYTTFGFKPVDNSIRIRW